MSIYGSVKLSKYTPRSVQKGPNGEKLTTSAMIASLAAPGQRVKAAPFGHALVELAATRPDIVGLTADLSKYTDLFVFAKAYPERFYQMGMAEAVLMSAAAGLAREGFTPAPMISSAWRLRRRR
jgi:transketolase